jgi:TatD DNase family protein
MLINIHTHHIVNPFEELVNQNYPLESGYFSFGEALGSEEIGEASNEATSDEVFKHKNCLAIGEIGLDKNLSISLDKQIQNFIKQVFISEKYKLPIILHCVKSWNEISRIRKELNPKQPWIFHGFRKTNLVNDVLNSGLSISIGTAVLWDKKLQDCIQSIPIERLFLETDDDEKHTIKEVYQKLALIKNISLQTLEKQLIINTKNTFQKWEIG